MRGNDYLIDVSKVKLPDTVVCLLQQFHRQRKVSSFVKLDVSHLSDMELELLKYEIGYYYTPVEDYEDGGHFLWYEDLDK